MDPRRSLVHVKYAGKTHEALTTVIKLILSLN